MNYLLFLQNSTKMNSLILLFIFLFNTSIAFAEGAMAKDPIKGNLGLSSNEKNIEEANKSALASCRSSGCQIVANFKNSCAAWAVAENISSEGWLNTATKEEAITGAIQACSKLGAGCKAVLAHCDNLTDVNNNISQHPSNYKLSVANNYAQACYNAQGNFKNYRYSDGTEAWAVRDAYQNLSNGCGCQIRSASIILDIYPSRRGTQGVIEDESPNIWNILTEEKYPFGGCPTEADYLKLSQDIKNHRSIIAKDAEKNETKIKPLTKRDIAALQKICPTIVAKDNAAKYACAASNNPDCLQIKRNLIGAEIGNFSQIPLILSNCSELGYPLNPLNWYQIFK